MIVVSLDQNFLSGFAKQRPPDVVRLHSVLDRCVGQGKVICPLHGAEMVFEALLASHLSAGIFSAAEQLSGGVGFQNFAISSAINTLRLVRPRIDFPPFFPDAVKYWMPDEPTSEANNNRLAKRLFLEKVAAIPYPPSDYKPNMTIGQIREAIVTQRAGSIYRLLCALAGSGRPDTGKDEWEVATTIVRFLVDCGITTAEIETLKASVLNRKWDAIPTLFIHSCLCAYLEWDCLKANRQIKANDHFDLWRLCVALLDADVIFCDASMQALIGRAKLDEFLDLPRLFSISETAQAVAYFEAISEA